MPVTTTLAPTAGGPHLLTLWLLLTTNPNFVSAPGEIAAKASAHAFDPVPGPNDKIKIWADIEKVLTANNPNAAYFVSTQLQDFVLSLHNLHLIDANGDPSISYAEVVANACEVFQNIQRRFTPWGRPSPTRMDEILL